MAHIKVRKNILTYFKKQKQQLERQKEKDFNHYKTRKLVAALQKDRNLYKKLHKKALDCGAAINAFKTIW